MQRWNGWGEDNIYFNLPNPGRLMLHDLIGKGQGGSDYPLEKFIERIPESRLVPHPLISSDPKLRLDHAHGQSLPDWIGLRAGKLQRYPDGVALPTATLCPVMRKYQRIGMLLPREMSNGLSHLER